MFESDLPIIGNWLEICGIDVEEYVAMLWNNCSADGLEVWITSLALGQPLNIIFESAVWLTAGDGFDHAYPSLLLTSHEEAILCEQEPQENVPDLSHLGAAALSQIGKRRGCPVTSIPEYLQQPDLDHMDTDPEELLEVQNTA